MTGKPASSAHPAVAVNGGFLGAIVFGWGAWALWPTAPEWWGLGVASVMLGMGAVACLGSTIGTIVGRYRREHELHRYLSQGGAPKSARLASNDDLRRAGMIE